MLSRVECLRRALRRQVYAGMIVVVAGIGLMVGSGLSSAATRLGATTTLAGSTTTLPPATSTSTRLVTIRVKGRVIRRVDHVLLVRVPRVIFIHDHSRIIVPAHVVRLRRTTAPSGAPVNLIAGVTPVPVTVTVPVYLTGPTTTVTATTTATVTSTELVPTTVTTTITVPLGETTPARRRS